MNFEQYVSNLPKFHFWDGGPQLGFSPRQMRMMREVVTNNFPDAPRIIETGASNSTIGFLLGNHAVHLSICMCDGLHDKMIAYCTEHGVDATRWRHYEERSELILPDIMEEDETYDVALIDGGHAWPTVFVDFCYINMMLRKGGILMLGDLNLHSVKELVRLLNHQPEWKELRRLEHLVVFRKLTDDPFAPNWTKQPYIVQASKR